MADKKYKFVRIKGENKDSSFWAFVPQYPTQVFAHFTKYVHPAFADGMRVYMCRVMGEDIAGTPAARLADVITAVQDKTGQGAQSAFSDVEVDLFESRRKSVEEGKEIYLLNGPQEFGFNKDRHEILETVYRETLIFPEVNRPQMSDVRFIRWEGGIHYYAKIGNLDVVDENRNQKWNTKAEAEKAARGFIDREWII